jgi:hypothetical protein
VRGLPVDVLKALQEVFFLEATVQQMFYSSYCNSIPTKLEEATGERRTKP